MNLLRKSVDTENICLGFLKNMVNMVNASAKLLAAHMFFTSVE